MVKKDTRRLDELVKQTLIEYEAPETAADWEKMETILGVAPKASAGNIGFPSLGGAGGTGLIKKVTSSYIVIAAVMLAGGSYLLYTILKSPKTDNSAVVVPSSDTVAPAPVEAPSTVSASPAPVENVSPVATAADKLKDSLIAKTELAAEEKKKEETAAKEAEEKKEAEIAEKKKADKAEADKIKAADKKREEKAEEKRKADKKEKERLAAKEKEKNTAPTETLKKSNNPIGLNFLRSVNLDSLKKQQSQQPTPPVNDSTKAP